jgi:hypothetical protein
VRERSWGREAAFIEIELWDQDLGSDDQIDINSIPGVKHLPLVFDLDTATWSRDVPDNQPFVQGDGDDD